MRFWYLFPLLVFLPLIPHRSAPAPVPIHPVKIDDNFYFAQAKAYLKKYPPQNVEAVAAIVPHHFPAAYIIADTLNQLRKANPKTVIIIGPNHQEAGSHWLLTSIADWDTPLGLVETNGQITRQLVESRLAQIDESTVSSENSLTSVLPFIKLILPQSKVVTLITKYEAPPEALAHLVSIIKQNMQDSVLIASVDFSHYLDQQTANFRDQETRQLISSFSTQKLMTLNSEYLDSPVSIVTALKVSRELGATQPIFLHHLNSSEIFRDNSSSTTGYFGILFSSPQKNKIAQ